MILIPRTISEQVERAGPLEHAESRSRTPVLVLAGECWALTAMCRWRRLLRGDALKLARSTPDAEDRAWDLVGRRVVAAEKHGRDPMLRIWDGSVIDWVSDSDTDPWVLRLPGCNHRRMAAEPMRLR